jgi:hypothetical protein
MLIRMSQCQYTTDGNIICFQALLRRHPEEHCNQSFVNTRIILSFHFLGQKAPICW